MIIFIYSCSTLHLLEFFMLYQRDIRPVVLSLLCALMVVLFNAYLSAHLAAYLSIQSFETTGDWQANLTISKDKTLPLIIHLKQDDGKLSGYLESPTTDRFDQQAQAITGSFIEGSFIQTLTFHFIEQSISSHFEDVVVGPF